MVPVVMGLAHKNEVLGGQVGNQFLKRNRSTGSNVHDLAGTKSFGHAYNGCRRALRRTQSGTADDAQADPSKDGHLHKGHRITSPREKKD